MPETTFKILVTHPEVPQEGLDLMGRSCELIVCQSLPPTRSEILEKARGVHAMFWASHEPLNAEVLNVAGPQLKAISTMSAGIDYVDVEELKKRKIPLGHTPTVLNNAVADLGIGLMIAALKTNQLFAAGLDVVTPEPLHSTEKLLSLPNCVIVPHLGSATMRTRIDMATITAHNVLLGLAGEPMLTPAY